MDKCYERRLKLAEEFKACKKIFIALGDETRQHILMAILEDNVNGIRVGDITKKTHLSRPAVSHHLQILKNAGIINMYREGTKNYYYANGNGTVWKKLFDFTEDIYSIVQEVSYHGCSISESERIDSVKEE